MLGDLIEMAKNVSPVEQHAYHVLVAAMCMIIANLSRMDSVRAARQAPNTVAKASLRRKYVCRL